MAAAGARPGGAERAQPLGTARSAGAAPGPAAPRTPPRPRRLLTREEAAGAAPRRGAGR